MAKRARGQESSSNLEEQTGGMSAVAAAEHKIEEFAEDLGRLLGTARAKAEGWIGQRQTVARHLEEIRDTAAELLKKLGSGSWLPSPRAAGPDATRPQGRRPQAEAVAAVAEVAAPEPRKRTMSAAARQAISDAQKARWARQKKAAKKGEKGQ